ncbi:General transcription factor II-I repeat domain-containing protein 2A [Anthophora quadrimaculata]
MNHVMNVVIKIVNYIRSNALQHRQFKEFLSELSSEYGDIVYLTNMKFTKSSSRALLTDANLESQLRCATSNINIDLQKLSERKDKQISR